GERADGVWSRAVTGSGETDPATRDPRRLVGLGRTHELGPRDPHRVNARANVDHTRNAGAAPKGPGKAMHGNGSRSECRTQECWNRARGGRGVVTLGGVRGPFRGPRRQIGASSSG